MVMLLHDKLKLCHANARFASNLIPIDDGSLSPRIRFLDGNSSKGRAQQDSEFWCRWASTQYRGSYHSLRDLYWPAPSAMSIWSMDQFRRCWNQTVSWVSSSQATNVPSGEIEDAQSFRIVAPKKRAEALAYGWIAAGCAVIDTKEIQPLGMFPEYLNWRDLFIQLNLIAEKYNFESRLYDTESARCAKNWLQNVVLMMMPEMGLPTHLMFQLLFGLNVEDLGALSESFMGNFPQGLTDSSENAWKFFVELCLKVAKAIQQLHASDLRDLGSELGKISFLHRPGMPPSQSNEHDSNLLQQFSENRKQVINWYKKFPLIQFIEANKTEIRARRGVRLALLQHISDGKLTELMRGSRAIFLAGVTNSEVPRILKHQFGEVHGDHTQWKLFTTGEIFTGGGLVPHSDEIPKWPLDDSSLSIAREFHEFNDLARGVAKKEE